MKKTLQWLNVNFEPYMMAILFYAMVALVTLQVIMRFVFSSGFSWGEEVAKFMFVWLMYFGFSYATKNNRHIRVSYFVAKLPEKLQRIIMVFCDVLFLVFSCFVFVSLFVLCETVFRFSDKTVAMDLTMNILYGAAVVGFALMIVRILQNIIWKIKHFHSSLEEYENFGGVYTPNNKISLYINEESEMLEVDSLEISDEISIVEEKVKEK